MTNPVILSQTVYASTAHRYWNPQWTAAQNRLVYGRDASAEGLGSNLRLELAMDSAHESKIWPALRELKRKVDHQCLFNEGTEFTAKSSTLENITRWLCGELPAEWFSLTVWETERLGCRISSREPELAVLIFKLSNLTLKISGARDAQSGLVVERAKVTRAVGEQLAKLNENNDMKDEEEWSRKLFIEFKNSFPGLCSLAIDLGSHESLVVHS